MSDMTDIAQERDQLIRAETVAHQLAGIRIAAAMPGLLECESCTDPIGAERLKATPSARRCVTCQSDLEHRLKGHR